MNLEITILSEVSQTKKHKYHINHLNVNCFLKVIQMNFFTNRNRLTDIRNKLMVTKEERWRGIN